jgi:hypothetical protein
MKAPPAIIIVGALLAILLGYMAWQEPGREAVAASNPAAARRSGHRSVELTGVARPRIHANMHLKPTIIVAAILVCLGLAYLAGRAGGPQQAAPDRPPGFETGKPGTPPAGR